uniref:Uncharacterized protein n=1 Tax=Arundo donax TaxID=35708 RepID=A0A0A9HC60_ARUDO
MPSEVTHDISQYDFSFSFKASNPTVSIPKNWTASANPFITTVQNWHIQQDPQG